MASMSKKNKKKQSIDLAAQSGAASEVVSRYGSAEKGHFVAYSGKDNETGKVLKRGLKKTAQSRVNPNAAKQNIKQQAGYAAEDKYVARQNAEKIIKGEPERYTRTDDLGRVNDPLFDHVLISEDGCEIIGSGEQMKFVGGNPRACLNKLASEKFQKYLDADATITVPSDFYEGVLAEADKEIESLQQQLNYARQSGRADLEKSLQQRIDKIQKIKESVKDSGISNAEAIEARLHPKISTAKDVAKLSHRAGVEQAKIGAAVSGGISLIRNIVAVVKGDKEAEDAAKDFVIDAGSGAATGYVTAFAGSAIKGGMQNANSAYVRTLSKTNLPATIVTSTIDVGKSMTRFIKGEITGLECLEELGEKGTGHLSAAMFATLGQIAIPIPVVGAMVGSVIGYALSSAFYKEFVGSLKEARIAKDRRKQIEEQCSVALSMIAAYRADIDLIVYNYLQVHQEVFTQALSGIDQALVEGDIDTFISSANLISKQLGHNVQFETMDEFDLLMASNNKLKL
jgi:hypothetical protein